MEEIWKDVVGYEGLYQVSNLGNIKSLDKIVYRNGKYPFIKKQFIIIGGVNKQGYLHVCLWKNGNSNTIKRHRLVADAFIPNPDNKPQVNHINGIKSDNRVENLEWCTSKENINHAISIGLMNNKGVSNKKAKLSEKDVMCIRNAKHKSRKELSIFYNVTISTIDHIITRKTWQHI